MGDLTDDWVHMLLYGRNRIGKTTLACEFPKPLALIAVEHSPTGGSKSVKRIEGVTHFSYARFKEENPQSDLTHSGWVEQMGLRLQSDDTFQSAVLDSGTSLDEIVLAEICGWDRPTDMNRFGKVSQDQYTERSERMRKVLRAYLDLAKHVVILANEKDHNPPEGRKSAIVRGIQSESYFAAAMGGGTTRWVQDGCDYLCQLYMDKEVVARTRTVGKEKIITHEETGRTVRRLRTSYHPNFAAGIRSENPEKVPEYIEAGSSQEMYEKFMAVVRGDE